MTENHSHTEESPDLLSYWESVNVILVSQGHRESVFREVEGILSRRPNPTVAARQIVENRNRGR